VSADSEPVPKLPRGRGFRLRGVELVRIGLTLVMLIGVIMLTRPCANAVSSFVTGFGSGSSAAQQMPTPENVAPPMAGSGDDSGSAFDPGSAYETLRPGMTDEEIKAAIERARARAACSASGAGSGSATR
jgi:hypothetical protein